MPLRRSTSLPSTLTRTLATIGATSLTLYTAKVLLNLFGPQPSYAIAHDLDAPLDSEPFLQFLSIVTGGTRRRAQLRRLRNGTEFYPEYLAAIRAATQSINLEYYEFIPGSVSAEILDALTAQAKAGVEVRILVDAIGSISTSDSLFDPFRAAGGRMCWYHPFRWDTWQHMNQRTHRKLLIIDGETGFMGGAGIGDHWLKPTADGPAWRDTVFRVRGEAVAGLISTFAENWLEASGHILSGPRQFSFRAAPESPTSKGCESFVISSTPRGGGTQARILFQALIKSARQSITITTPYFLPDRPAREALANAARNGVKVRILTAGPFIDHPYVRTLSRNSSHRILRAGAEIHEYQPSMIHAKLMTIDSQWCVFGSTNFDHRSFALNDEVNLACLDPTLARTLEADFEADLAQSRPLTLETLSNRTPLGKIQAILEEPLESES